MSTEHHPSVKAGGMPGPFDEIRVLDLCHTIAGQYCSMLLGDSGAEVVKVESLSGDPLRTFHPPFVGDESAIFLALNRNKKSLSLDISAEPGRHVLSDLCRSADVVLDDFSVRGAEPELRRLQDVVQGNSGIIHCSINGFGEEGPLAQSPASELAVQAMSDVTNSLGTPGQEPVRVGPDIAQLAAGLSAFVAVEAAILQRDMTGEGERIDVSMLGTMLHLRSIIWAAFSNPDAGEGYHLNTYNNPPKSGYKTKDRPIYFNLRRGTLEEFYNIINEMGLEEYLDNPAFQEGGRDTTGLGKHADQWTFVWEDAFRSMTATEVIDIVKRNNGEAVPFNDYASLLDDPQVVALDMIKEVCGPDSQPIRVPRLPYRFSSLQPPWTSPPRCGQHTDEVLQSIGYSSQAIASLRKEKVV